MKRIFFFWLISLLCIAAGGSSRAETTLEKIDKGGTLTIGTRRGSPPFAYINQNNDWVGFSIELVEKAVLPALSKKLNKQIKLEKKESMVPPVSARSPLSRSAPGAGEGT